MEEPKLDVEETSDLEHAALLFYQATGFTEDYTSIFMAGRCGTPLFEEDDIRAIMTLLSKQMPKVNMPKFREGRTYFLEHLFAVIKKLVGEENLEAFVYYMRPSPEEMDMIEVRNRKLDLTPILR